MAEYDAMEDDMEEVDDVKQYDEVLLYGFHFIFWETKQVLVPSTACIWVMLGYLTMGTIMFAEWEDWNYLDSAYFCVTSLLKVNSTLDFN